MINFDVALGYIDGSWLIRLIIPNLETYISHLFPNSFCSFQTFHLGFLGQMTSEVAVMCSTCRCAPWLSPWQALGPRPSTGAETWGDGIGRVILLLGRSMISMRVLVWHVCVYILYIYNYIIIYNVYIYIFTYIIYYIYVTYIYISVTYVIYIYI